MVKELEVDLLVVFDHLYSSYIYEKSYKLLFPDFSFLIYSLYTYSDKDKLLYCFFLFYHYFTW